jgi:hypothetical protein
MSARLPRRGQAIIGAVHHNERDNQILDCEPSACPRE